MWLGINYITFAFKQFEAFLIKFPVHKILYLSSEVIIDYMIFQEERYTAYVSHSTIVKKFQLNLRKNSNYYISSEPYVFIFACRDMKAVAGDPV